MVDKGGRSSKTLQNNVGRSPPASITCHCSLPYPFVQLGRAPKALVLGRADSVLQTRKGAPRTPAYFPSLLQLMETMDVCPITTPVPLVGEPDKHIGKCVRPRSASLGVRGGVARQSRGGRCLNILMWCVGLLTIPLSLPIYTPCSRRYPSPLPMMAKSLGMQVSPTATVS
jgi:hypothetical protein